MSDDSTNITNLAPDNFNIRKTWHNSEWYYSVVDIIAEASERTQSEATEYWRKLRNRLAKEGNDLPIKCHKLKLYAADKKMRLTAMVNEQLCNEIIETVKRISFHRIRRLARHTDELAIVHPAVFPFLKLMAG